MKVLEVTSREFRERQKIYFELADKGEKVIIKRGKQAYVLTPVPTDSRQLSPQMESKIQQAIQEAQEGKAIEVRTKEELYAFLESL